MINLYFISGLGADKSAFSRIELDGVNINHIEWINHSQKENLQSYCKKLLPQFDTSKPFVIVGLSFGGIIAQEISKLITPQKTILISSVYHHKQFPWFYQLGKFIVPVLPNFIFTRTNSLINYLFGAKGKNTSVLDKIMKANDPLFVKWCVTVLLKWKKKGITNNLITIHGTNDKIIPYHKCNYTVENGSHFMVYSKAKELENILQSEINKLNK